MPEGFKAVSRGLLHPVLPSAEPGISRNLQPTAESIMLNAGIGDRRCSCRSTARTRKP